MTSAVAMKTPKAILFLEDDNVYKFEDMIRVLDECCNQAPCGHEDECKQLFNKRIDQSEAYTMGKVSSYHADTQGSGKPDTSGSWIPQVSLGNRYKEVLM